jgi:hypothetical protein
MKSRSFAVFALVAGMALFLLLTLGWTQPMVAAQSRPFPIRTPRPDAPAAAPRQVTEPLVAPAATPEPELLSAASEAEAKQKEEVSPPLSIDRARAGTALRGAPFMFVENVGQFDVSARFQARRGNTTIYLADDALWLTISEQVNAEAELRRGINLKLSFPGADPHPRLEPFDRVSTHVSYFVGDDPANWHADVPVWSGVRYVDLYPGVDLEITGDDGRWTWRLVCEADCQSALQNVRLCVDGADSLSLEGDYVRLTTALGDLVLPLLQAASADAASADGTSSNLLSIQPEIKGAEITTSLTLPSSLSPSPQAADDLLYGTYLGGDDEDAGRDITVDKEGDIYAVGYTESANFPKTTGAFSETLGGERDAFVVKIHPAGEGTDDLVYGTYLGGGGSETAYGIAVDGNGNAYVTGNTGSFNFPSTTGAFAACDSGGAFVTKLNATGSALVYGGCIVGVNIVGHDIALDNAGQAHVAGVVSGGLLTTTGAYEESPQGGSDAFITIVSTDGMTITYASYIGGSGHECSYVGYTGRGCTLALDGEGDVYISGGTLSNDFPTKNAYDSDCGNDGTCNSAWDAFVAKLTPAGGGTNDLVYATYLGGTANDFGSGIAVDGTGSAYVTGMTASTTDFPITGGSFSPGHNGGYADAFVTKLNSAGNGLVYSSYLGGSGAGDYGWDIAVDNEGQAYASGQTNSDNFPVTDDAYDAIFADTEAYVAVVSTDGVTLTYATYLGGDAGEIGHAIAVTGTGDIYTTGRTESSNLPTSEGAYDRSYNNNIDAFVVWLRIGGAPTFTPTVDFGTFPYNVDEGGGPATITITLSAASSSVVTVNYATSDDTAVAGQDYTATSGTLTFTPGLTKTTFTVAINDDALDEVDETLILTLSNAINANIGDNNPATLTITDNDEPPTVDFDRASYSVDEDSGPATIAVTLSAASGTTVTVNYATSNGTATAGEDYTAVGDTLTFDPGTTELTFSVPLIDDVSPESSETAVLALSGANNATLGTVNNPATLTIIDDDGIPTPTPTPTPAPFYSTFLGGSESDYGTDIAIDGDGDAYIIGWTSSSDFPASTGAFSETLSGVDDAFVVKIHPAGDGTNDRVYATYVGGGAGDSAGGITVDENENVYITGWSNDFFPDTDGSFHDCDSGGAFVAKLNDTGSDLLYSGCIVGFNAEAQDIALDSTGQVYVSGKTGDGFPVTSGAYQETYGGGSYDAFLAIVSTDGTTLTYATYVGGNDAECNGSASGCTLDLDGSDNVYLAGDTESPNFPTKNAYDDTCGTDGDCNPSGGYMDAFLIKLDPAGNGTNDLLYATFIGDSGGDVAAGVVVDGGGNAYLTGHTTSHEFPITSGAYDEDFNGGNADVFLLKLDPGGGSSGLIYSTFLGGASPGDKGRDIAVDENGYAYAVGTTNSSGFPTTFDGYDTSLGGTDDAFVVKLDPAGNGQADLLYATFLGGNSGTEIGYALTVDDSGNIYVTGETKSDDFPTSINSYDTSFNGGTYDAFVVRLPTAKYHTHLPLILRNQ